MPFNKYERRNLTELNGTQILSDVKEMIRRGRSEESTAQFIERVILSRVNAEREQVATELLLMEVRVDEPAVCAAARRGDEALVAQVVSISRRRAAKLLRDRIEEVEDL